MPILVLIDVSLSMLAPLDGVTAPGSGDANRRTAAIDGVSTFLEYLESHSRYEIVSLASFSDDVDMTEFTRDYATLKDLLTKSETYEARTRTNIVDALRGVFYRCVAVWGSNVLCHVVFLTDCAGYVPDFERLVNSVAQLEGKDTVPSMCKLHCDDKQLPSASDASSPFAQEFRQLSKRGHFALHVVCVNNANTNDLIVQQNVRFYKKLVEIMENGSTFRCIDDTTPTSWIVTFRKLADELSAPSPSILHCGTFSAPVDVFPTLKPIRSEHDFETVLGQLGEAITIVGFVKPSELGSPPITSRHLLLSAKSSPNSENVDPTKHRSADADKNPNFCVLLHGAMKVEDMVAICEVGPGWYGYIYHVPNIKHSNLILHCFEPGINAVPWLGPLNKLVMRPFAGPPAPGTPAVKSPFPISFKSKPSYATTNPNWIHTYGVQADVQKVLRYARKLPEKEPQFHQELNRLCNYALSLGFVELHITLARIFEKELLTMGPNSPQAVILKNIVNALASGRIKHGEAAFQFTR